MTVPAPGQDNPQVSDYIGDVPLPERVVIGANGAYWRAFDSQGYYSMCVVSTDNDPVDEIAVYVPEERIAALAAALEAATRERDALAARLRDAPLGGNGSHWEGCWRSHIDCASARVKDAERALAEANEQIRKMLHDKDEDVQLIYERAVTAERALEAARDALREIVNGYDGDEFEDPSETAERQQAIARDALDASASTEGET